MRRIPLAGWLCALVAGLSALAWSFVTPPFHVPDEVAHVAYAQQLAETGDLPKLTGALEYSPDEQQVLTDTDFYLVVGIKGGRPPWTSLQQDAIERQPQLARTGTGTAQSATNNPPLYYALQAAPYWLGRGAGLFDQMALMRLLSVLMAAGTGLAVFLFLRELLPDTPWAWPVGALAVGMQPLFGFVSAGVQPDALLALAGALTLLGAARVMRRGLDARTGALLGAAAAVGVLSKLAFIGLVPGVVLAVALGVRRALRDRRRADALRGAVLALGIPAMAAAAYALASVLIWDRSLYGADATTPVTQTDGGPPPAEGSLRERISYMWQLYLPRLPFMDDQFPASPLREVWTNGFIGRFGWLDTAWSPTVYRIGAWVLLAIAVLAVIAAVRAARRGAFAGRIGELCVYGVIAGGLLALIGASGYAARLDGGTFEQARYLLPLMGLYGAVVALAAKAAGARWGPALGALLVALAFGHDLFAQLLTVGRFWG